MRILIVSFYYYPEVGAAPSRITNMAQGLRQRGVEVDVLTCLPNYPKGRIFEGYRHCFSKKEIVNDVNVFRYWTYATVARSRGKRLLSMFSFAFTLWAFAWRVRRILSYDCVIVQSPPLPVACSVHILFGLLMRRCVILNVSDLWPESAVRIGAVTVGSLPWRILCSMEKFAYHKAKAIQGQSQPILDHIASIVPEKPLFLYRNLQPATHREELITPQSGNILRLVYAGLLGEAQDMAGIVREINFKSLGAELHIYGGGTQCKQVEQAASEKRGVYYHGVLSKSEVGRILPSFDAGIVPLAKDIPGAVPSKIFDLMAAGVPVFYCGEGEARTIVQQYGIGYVSPPGDHNALAANISRMIALDKEERQQMHKRTEDAAKGDFSQERQIEHYAAFLKKIIKR